MENNKELFSEDMQRMIGRTAQRNNIAAAKTVADIIKTTLGPKGMDKMLVSPEGDIIITNDGVTILEEMQIEHPAAKTMIEVAQTQESEVGDGTTTAVMLAGKLLENAEKLLDKKIHATAITKGYRIASEQVQKILNEISLKITPEDLEILKKIAATAMTGKSAESSKEKLSDIIVNAIKQISEGIDTSLINLKDIKIEKTRGNSIDDTELINGIVLDKEKTSSEMPSIVENSKIALIDFSLEQKNPEIQTRISVSNPEQLRNFLNEEENIIKEMIEKISSKDVNVLICQKGIDDYAQYLLAKKGIYALRRVSQGDMNKIAKATSGKIISNIDDITEQDLGNARQVAEKMNSGETFTYITGCENPRALTILIRGGTEHILDEIERAVLDGLGDVISCLKSNLVVAGGGAIEIELAKRLEEFSQTLAGREQLAVKEFASALEFVPITLAENAGMDPIDTLTELKSLHSQGQKNMGLNLFENKIADTLQARIIEPWKIKSQAISSACETAIMILRIDDVIASKSQNKGNEKSEKGKFIEEFE